MPTQQTDHRRNSQSRSHRARRFRSAAPWRRYRLCSCGATSVVLIRDAAPLLHRAWSGIQRAALLDSWPSCRSLARLSVRRAESLFVLHSATRGSRLVEFQRNPRRILSAAKRVPTLSKRPAMCFASAAPWPSDNSLSASSAWIPNPSCVALRCAADGGGSRLCGLGLSTKGPRRRHLLAASVLVPLFQCDVEGQARQCGLVMRVECIP